MTTETRRTKQHPVFRVHRIGSVVVALVLWAFAIAGLVKGVGFVTTTTHGERVFGMTSDGLLSTISLVVGAILIAAAVLGGRIASTTAAVIGGLFLLSGLVNLIALVHPNLNVLAFTMPNVVFSLVVGLVLLCIGLWGRASGQLPADNPYRQARGGENPVARAWHGEQLAQESTDEDEETLARRIDENTEMAEAEYAFAQGTASPTQEREVMEDAQQRADERRQEAWRRAEEDNQS